MNISKIDNLSKLSNFVRVKFNKEKDEVELVSYILRTLFSFLVYLL